MAVNFYKYLNDNGVQANMPAITIETRATDKSIIYNHMVTRYDRIAEDIYGDASAKKLIEWGNPEYSLEFDIPDNSVVRVPYPYEEVLQEVLEKIVNLKNL